MPSTTRRSVAVLSALWVLGAAPVGAQSSPLASLAQQLEPLRARFNQDVGKVRLLVIVDPTCPPCRWGASDIEHEVLETVNSDRVAAYVVWLPVLNFQDESTLQRNGQHESHRVSDPRATQFIDPNGFVGKAYSTVFNIRYHSPAWDVYLAFGPDARWDAHVPSPSFWMQQGDLPGAPQLDGHKLADYVRQLLAKGKSASLAH
jgi:hypothetical protein